MINKRDICLMVVLVVGILPACATKVSRVKVDTVTDLSGRWNDTDSRLVFEEMVKDALNRPWLDKFLKAKGKEPTVIVGRVVNRSHEHINVQTFTKDLERELTNSGRGFLLRQNGNVKRFARNELIRRGILYRKPPRVPGRRSGQTI